MQTCVLIFFFILFGSGLCVKTAKLRYYFSSADDYKELPLETAKDIFVSEWYNTSRSSVIFCHGFTGHPKGPAVTAVINSYLGRGDSNVMLLNWDEMAASYYPSMVTSYVNWAAPNARTEWLRAVSTFSQFQIGYSFAETLLRMSEAGFDLNKTHLVGHSLGAHIFGIAGNTLLQRGILLPWITGLDPAGVGFEGKNPQTRLSPASAKFVSVIHSDPGKYGFRRSLGTVDFWPNYRANGAVIQPGCFGKGPMFSPEDLCNHNRCWQLLVDANKYPGSIIGSYAKNYRKWKNSTKENRASTVLEIGVYKKNITPGNYYFTTSASTPYGLGKAGI